MRVPIAPGDAWERPTARKIEQVLPETMAVAGPFAQARGNGGIGHSDVDDQLAVVCEDKGHRREFAGKPKGMNKQTRKTNFSRTDL